jgi:protein phosphatase
VDLGALSHPGKVRTNNEDHYLVARLDRALQTLLTNLPAGSIPQRSAETAYGMLVADGMGGHAAGEVASQTAISVLVELVLQTPDWIMWMDEHGIEEVLRRLEHRLGLIQDALVDKAMSDAKLFGMGTTMTLTCSLGADLLLAHVGDSRAYLFRQGQLEQLTRDQTLAQELVDRGVMSKETAATHPLRHKLTSALSATPGRHQVQLSRLRLEDGDQVLLCTDGLTEMVAGEDLVRVLEQAGSAADACRVLVDRALEAGGKDNVTVVLGRYRLPAQED